MRMWWDVYALTPVGQVQSLIKVKGLIEPRRALCLWQIQCMHDKKLNDCVQNPPHAGRALAGICGQPEVLCRAMTLVQGLECDLGNPGSFAP